MLKPNDKYSLLEYTQYIWKGDTVYNESVFPLCDKDGSIKPIALIYPVSSVINVRNSALTETYTEGEDYKIEDGNLVIIPEGKIKTVKYDDYYFEEQRENSKKRTGGGYIFFGEECSMHDLQLSVSYKHSSAWQGFFQQFEALFLPKTMTKLSEKKELKVVIFGDSISVGHNSSGLFKAPPFAPPWFEMAIDMLQVKFEYYDIVCSNRSESGRTSAWGAENAGEWAQEEKADLAIIAFGMNDARVKPKKFKKNISNIMKKLKRANRDCEFILVSTMLPNSEFESFFGNQPLFIEQLKELKRDGVAIADMTSMHANLLEKKRYYDMSGNNVNHPNDFLARVYAQCVIAVIAGDFF